MSLTVLTPAPVTDLLELASLKTRLGITGTSEDTVLAEYIDEIGSVLRETEAFGRELVRQQYVESFYPRRGVSEIRLSCNPVDPESVSVTLDGEALEADDFEIRDAEAGILYRSAGWPSRDSSDEGDGVTVTYKGGFLLPASATAKGVVTSWAAATAYLTGAWVRAVGTPAALRFECTTPGTSHAATEPTWPTTAGGTVTDGTVTWTARTAWEMPLQIRLLATAAIKDMRSAVKRPAGLSSLEGDSFAVSYSVTGSTSTGISQELLARLGPLRARYGRC